MKSHLLGTVSIYNAFLGKSSAGTRPVCRLKIAELNLSPLVLASILMLWGTQTRSIANPQYLAFIHSSGTGAHSLEDARTGSVFNDFSGAGSGVTFNNLMDPNITFYFNGRVTLQDLASVPEPGAWLLLVIGSTGLVITTISILYLRSSREVREGL